jgi:hypothetical protein
MCLKTFGDTLISESFFPRLIPTKLSLEDKTCVGNAIKEEGEGSIPLKLRFLAGFLRMAFCIVSSFVAIEPSSATTCLVLRLGGAPYEVEEDGGAALYPCVAAPGEDVAITATDVGVNAVGKAEGDEHREGEGPLG